MNSELLWNKIGSELNNAPIELATVPSNNKKTSTKMSQRRKISKDDFFTVYDYYHRWANGERYLRQEVRRLSRNTAYIFGFVAKFECSL
jgi:spore germination protein GerM